MPKLPITLVVPCLVPFIALPACNRDHPPPTTATKPSPAPTSMPLSKPDPGVHVHRGMIADPANPFFYNLVGTIPEDQLQENPEAFLAPREGKDGLIYSRFDAGELYGHRLALKHLRTGAKSTYLPTQKYQDVDFIKGFLAGYSRTISAALPGAN